MPYNKEYYEKNREKLIENQRRYRERRHEEILERQRKVREGFSREYKDELNRKAREKRAALGDEARERYKMYYYKRKERLKKEGEK